MKASVEIRGIESYRELSFHLEFLAGVLRTVEPQDAPLCVNSAGMFNDGSLDVTDRFRMNLPPLRWVEMVIRKEME